MGIFLSSEASIRHRRGSVVVLIGMLTIAASGRAAEQPKSFAVEVDPQAKVDLKKLPPIDAERLRSEQGEGGKDRPQSFALSADVHLTLQNSGTWQTLSDGSRIWRLRIQSPGARSLNLGLSRFDLPEGAKLWIYSPSHDEVQGPYTARNRSAAGRLFTALIRGDEVVVELYVPAGTSQPIVEIATVNQGYRGFEKN